jgi:hypothetical protein
VYLRDTVSQKYVVLSSRKVRRRRVGSRDTSCALEDAALPPLLVLLMLLVSVEPVVVVAAVP